jgi:hypothetical protein
MTSLQNAMETQPSKSKRRFGPFTLLVIGLTLILSVTIYKSRVLEQYWHLQEVFQNQDKWDEQEITHYQMSVNLPYDTTYFGEMPMPLTIKVKDGSIISMVDGQGKIIPLNPNNDSAHDSQSLFTIPGLFLYVRQSIVQKPPAMEVSYDPVFGFPSRIYIDPYTEPCCQDFETKVEDFQVLP